MGGDGGLLLLLLVAGLLFAVVPFLLVAGTKRAVRDRAPDGAEGGERPVEEG